MILTWMILITAFVMFVAESLTHIRCSQCTQNEEQRPLKCGN